MLERDLFVGLVTIGLGASLLFGAIANSEWCYRLRLIRFLSQKSGRGSARVFLFVSGGFLCVLGVMIAQGFANGKSSGQDRSMRSGDLLSPHGVRELERLRSSNSFGV